MLKENLLQMKSEVEKRIAEASSAAMVDEIRVEFLGKKGKMTEILKLCYIKVSAKRHSCVKRRAGVTLGKNETVSVRSFRILPGRCYFICQ